MEDFCMKLRPFDRVMAVNRLFSSLLGFRFSESLFLFSSSSTSLFLFLSSVTSFAVLSKVLLANRVAVTRQTRSSPSLCFAFFLFCFAFHFLFSTTVTQSFAESSHRLSIVVPVSPNFRPVLFPVYRAAVCMRYARGFRACFLCLHEPAAVQIVPRGRALIFKKSSVKNYKKTVVFVV